MAKSRDTFIFKFMIFAGFIWLAVVVMVNLPGSHLKLSVDFDKSLRSDEWKFVDKDASFKPPVIQRLDLDRLKFDEARRKDAAAKLRMKEQEKKEKQIQEEIGKRKALDRILPPFKLAQNLSVGTNHVGEGDLVAKTTWRSSFDRERELRFSRLVQSGLIVPRWGNLPEVSLDSKSPGEFGVDVTIEKDNLPDIEKKKFDDGWQKNAFNQYASDMISVHRALPDVRDSECKSLKYRDNLPDTSVIIIFHNEAWSALLRTVHSVIDRSPPSLLKEIILVDDFSDLEHLQTPLENYMEKLGIVYILRAKSRQGLIRARLLGASRATGQVLTFLDSHCECAGGWLEPLLDRIAQNRSNVVTPIIDVLDDSTLQYKYSSAKATQVGGFDWDLQFNWHAIPEREMSRRKSAIEPVQTPTMAGGLFSIDKSYFEYLGTYDPGMDIWGGENLELSFRVWMCGGTLEIVLCSHVGHIFRERSPYSWGTGTNVLRKNSIRLAEVWMDDAKKYYYNRLGGDLGDYGDVTERKKLRQRLNCKSFQWYLTNIYPEMFVPGDALAAGEIRNKALGSFEGVRQPICLDSAADQNSMSKPLGLWPCHNMGGNQYWLLSKRGEIRRDDACMDVSEDEVVIQNCDGEMGNQQWKYTDENTLLHVATTQCLELSEDGTKIHLRTCSGINRQVWLFKRQESETSPETPGN